MAHPRSFLMSSSAVCRPGRIGACSRALAVVYGIQPMVILKDICGASDRETEAVVRWMMDALVDAALRDAR